MHNMCLADTLLVLVTGVDPIDEKAYFPQCLTRPNLDTELVRAKNDLLLIIDALHVRSKALGHFLVQGQEQVCNCDFYGVGT